ncbi:LysR family transcriptional regulator [Hamadaea tsunoensis]|uniref:LysR family transcriptional regulator n=1 Tax=Hamadaea tsunoensis TaxID=53368 RepID=UPI0004145DC9|nr:LysR family transcriptional regulator [Hamadaea tsunoensis]
MRLELRHLRVLCAIADAGSVTRAAAVLGLAPPALTTQLKRIEHMFGGRLFDRDHTGARPTELGELVLARARVLLPAVQALEDEAARLASSQRQDGGPAAYRIGAVNGPILGGLVSRLAAGEPAARLTTLPSWSTAELGSMLLDDRLDFALAGACGDPTTPLPPQLSWHLVAEAPVFVLVRHDHPFATAEEIDLAELAQAQWAATPGDGCFAECFAAACARAGFTPRPIFETDIAGCVDLVRDGHAVTLCQPTFRESPGVVVVPIKGAPLRWRHLVGWRPESPAAPGAMKVIELAEDAYAEAVGRSRAYVRWLQRHSQPR